MIRYVYLPEDGGKVGVDDFLAAGHSLDELYALAEDELRALPVERPHRPAAWPTMWLLGSVMTLLQRFVRFPSEHELAALALYVLHTWALDAAQATPYVLVVSPEKRAGKTRTLETVELCVREPLRAANISAAGVFQAIEAWTPTLLVDELDAVFRSRSESAEALRAVLNAGNRRGSYVVRGTQEGEPAKFSTFCAKVMAGINTGRLPDTIRDRSILLAIDRKRATEPVDDLFPAELADTLTTLRGRLEDWAVENVEALAAWRRKDRIAQLDDRLQEAWDPLLAIAEHAGGDWPGRAREAATTLAKGVDAADEAHGHLVLVALRSMFDAELDAEALASKTICEALNADEELPFGGYGDGVGIAPRGLAKLLKPYGIKPRTVRIKGEDGDDETPKGYHRDQFAEAWQRYAESQRDAEACDQPPHPPHPPQPTVHRGSRPEPKTPQKRHTPQLDFDVADTPADVADVWRNEIADEHGDVADVADVAHNGRPPRGTHFWPTKEPTCQNPQHRHSDYALPGAAMWICGVCHPPPPALRALALTHRNGAPSS